MQVRNPFILDTVDVLSPQIATSSMSFFTTNTFMFLNPFTGISVLIFLFPLPPVLSLFLFPLLLCSPLYLSLSSFNRIDNHSKNVVAIKIIDLEEAEDEIEDIQQEITILSQCDSAHVTRYYGSYLKVR